MQAIIGPDATWYVGEHETGEYRRCGAVNVAVGGDLVSARNAALDDAHHANRPCVQVDDDLRHLKVRTPQGTSTCTWTQAVATLASACATTGAHLAGSAPTDNPYFAHPDRPYATNLFVIGSLMYVQPSTPRFDPALRLKEDYDFTCQHLATYGLVARANLLLPSFRHYSNRGGAVSYRTTALEDQAVAYLRRKWPDAIKPHPRRAHEVLLRWPRSKEPVT